MQYEVEMKFPVADMAALEGRLVEMGAAVSAAETERDVYFAHPARDFARTDEALRIRRKAEKNFLTYKGPKVDATTKTRHEIDLPLPPGEEVAEHYTALLNGARILSRGRSAKVSPKSPHRLARAGGGSLARPGCGSRRVRRIGVARSARGHGGRQNLH